MKDKIAFILVMLTFGSIGIFVKHIQLSSSEIAFFRGAIGSLFLFVASILLKTKFSLAGVKPNRLLLLLSGAALGFNWIFLFESYRYTTVSNATLSYYFAPVFVMMMAPVLLKEKWSWKTLLSIVAAMGGLFFLVSPGAELTPGSHNHFLGIFYGLVAATLYASVIFMNKFIKHLSAYETTVIQLSIATVVLLPYVLLTEGVDVSGIDGKSILLLIILGIVHTGLAYFFYFPTVRRLKGQTVAIFSYIDPISAVVMSAVFLNESLSLNQVIGGVFILGSTFVSEIRKEGGKVPVSGVKGG